MKKIQFLPFYLVSLLAIALSCAKNEPDPTPPITNPTPVAPSNLVYSANSLTTCQNETKNSVTPTITGTPAPTFEATVNPTNAGITIDNVTGRILVSNTAATGTFKVSVKASNSAGNQTFTDIYTVNITAPNPSGVNFDEEVLNLVNAKCAPCHTTGSQPKWNDFNTAKNGINSMISRTKNGSMPQGGPPLSTAEIKILEDWVANCLIK
jgi:hypothetical protein